VRAVTIPRPGGPEVLEIADRPTPALAPGEVLIRASAAAVNPTDLLLRRTGDPANPPPWIPGTELAGTVAATGRRVLAVVDPRRPRGGAQAELVAVPVASVAPIPDEISDIEAAAVPMNALTVRQALRRLALARGATLGVIGAAGAVGRYAVELGAHAGLEVIADAQAHGAHHVVIRSEDPAHTFRTVAPDGVDGLIDTAVLDAAALGAIRDGGALATLRRWAGPSVRGIRIEPVWVPADFEDAEGLQEIAVHLAAGRLRPTIADTLPVDDVASAHRRLEAGKTGGRLVLRF
jgi:NADPH:quinone reductase